MMTLTISQLSLLFLDTSKSLWPYETSTKVVKLAHLSCCLPVVVGVVHLLFEVGHIHLRHYTHLLEKLFAPTVHKVHLPLLPKDLQLSSLKRTNTFKSIHILSTKGYLLQKH